MKNIALLFFCLVIFSCTEIKNDNSFIFSGVIENFKNANIIISSTIDYSIKDTLLLDNSGKFSDTLNLPSGFYNLSINNNRIKLYFNEGKNLNIAYNADSNLNTIKFTGSNAPENIFLQQKSVLVDSFFSDRQKLYNLKPSEFKIKLNKLNTSITSILESQKGLPDNFIKLEKNNLTYYDIIQLNGYSRTVKNKGDEYAIPHDYSTSLDSIDFNNENDYFYSSSYRTLFSNHYQRKASELSKKDSVNFSIALLKIIESYPNEKIKNHYLLQTVYSGYRYVNDFETYFNLFNRLSTNDQHKKFISQKYEERRKVAPGKDSPEFNDYENYAGGTSSLKDFRGKYVYIDVWATWCGPCRYEIPYLKEIEKSYHDKNIAFVSISVDTQRSQKLWRSTIKKQELGGVQLLAPNDWNSTFVKDYLITGIPRFILIDPSGKIVNYNAPRPSEQSLIDLFESEGI
ncbi:TlpA family protein disulfide reductase [Aestuariibaculum sediminum]|uniref:TlpA family protein disulfide reductase n=1 Tax=Aestuariibaculum sediminum TaxID=2770637 RepID=A0A8J6Q2R8_9FLAO|nr:TlpA disulfide reductase family protein [Aestuariibaculum sediminum]MBD0832564.1 TlpA family protein disulfide reductase [Aestuariibaculum sediminum]